MSRVRIGYSLQIYAVLTSTSNPQRAASLRRRFRYFFSSTVMYLLSISIRLSSLESKLLAVGNPEMIWTPVGNMNTHVKSTVHGRTGVLWVLPIFVLHVCLRCNMGHLMFRSFLSKKNKESCREQTSHVTNTHKTPQNLHNVITSDSCRDNISTIWIYPFQKLQTFLNITCQNCSMLSVSL